jgi:hypothetical protein
LPVKNHVLIEKLFRPEKHFLIGNRYLAEESNNYEQDFLYENYFDDEKNFRNIDFTIKKYTE